MKNSKMITAMLAGSLVVTNVVPVYASEVTKEDKKTDKTTQGSAEYTKYENVYASLGADGKASDAYIVNHFSVKDAGDIVDYGKYQKVRNLTTLENLTTKNNRVEFKADDGEFYYQGKVKNVELPWNYTIDYELDGKKMTAKELPGKNGKLKITFKSSKNEAVEKDFYDHYLMQVSLSLDCKKAENITAEGATIADAGENKQLSFTVLPGNDAEFVIEADVNDFSMSGFSIAAVPYSMQIDKDALNTDDFTGQITELTDAVSKLNEGTDSLKDGRDKLCGGNSELLKGSGKIGDGLNVLSSNSSTIISASAQIQSALQQISSQLNQADFSGITRLAELPDGLNQLADALDQMQSGLVTLQTNYAAAYAALDQAMQAGSETTLTEEEMGALQQSANDNEAAMSAYQKLMASYQQLQVIKGMYQNVKPAFDAVSSTLSSENGSSVAAGIGSVSANIRGIATSMSAVSETDIAGQMDALKSGLSTLASQYGEFHKGLSSYTDGVDLLAGNYGSFQSGMASYLNGTEQLKGGTAELADGMGQFADGVSTMPEEIEKAVDQAMENFSGGDYQAVSFTDDKNSSITSVQFVISTKGIEAAKEKKVDKTEEKQGFLDRLKALF